MHLAEREFVLSPVNARMEIVDARSGLVTTAFGEPQRRKVAIVGAGHGRQEAPYDDPEWEVWALNVCSSWDRQGRLRADRWFEMHEAKAQTRLDMQWISRCPVPIYLPPAFAAPFLGGAEATVGIKAGEAEGDPETWTGTVKNAVRYPLEVNEELHGSYWACTFAYQLALALSEGFTDVGMYGVDLARGTTRERTVEWANTSWWAGYLEGKGVTFHLASRCALGRHPFRYGVEYDQEIAAVQRYVDETEEVLLRDRDRRRGQFVGAIVGMGG